MKNEIITPIQTVAAYLDASPSGEELQRTGCQMIAEQFKSMPKHSGAFYRLAEGRYTDVYRDCTQWGTEYRRICRRESSGRVVCWMESFRVCRRWEYHVERREPGYSLAHQMGLGVQRMAEKAKRTCELASAGNAVDAEREAQDLLRWIQDDVKPVGEKLYEFSGCKLAP